MDRVKHLLFVTTPQGRCHGPDTLACLLLLSCVLNFRTEEMEVWKLIIVSSPRQGEEKPHRRPIKGIRKGNGEWKGQEAHGDQLGRA